MDQQPARAQFLATALRATSLASTSVTSARRSSGASQSLILSRLEWQQRSFGDQNRGIVKWDLSKNSVLVCPGDAIRRYLINTAGDQVYPHRFLDGQVLSVPLRLAASQRRRRALPNCPRSLTELARFSCFDRRRRRGLVMRHCNGRLFHALQRIIENRHDVLHGIIGQLDLLYFLVCRGAE